MLRNPIISLLLFAAVCFCVCASSFAQDEWLEKPPEPPPPERMEQLRQDIENMRIWKMTQYLELSPEQSTEFFPIFNEFQKDRDKLEKERAEMMRRLGELVESEKTSESEIKKIMSDLVKNRQKMFDLVDQFRRETGQVLTVGQQAKLVLFEERFKRDMHRMIEDVRRRHGFREGLPRRNLR